MSEMDLHEVKFEWPQTGPNSVVVTGTFDQWSSSKALTRTPTGFVGTVRVPWGQKFLYKFLVDGRWSLKNDQPIEVELGTGFVNHVYISPPKPVKAGLDGIEREAAKGSESPICVDHVESTVFADTQKNHTQSSSPSTEHKVVAVPQVLHTDEGPANDPSTEAPIVSGPAEEVKEVSFPHLAEVPEKAAVTKEEPVAAKAPLQPVVASVPKSTEETSPVEGERPSSETAYSAPPVYRPPATPTKALPFPTSGSPGSPPPSPTSPRFNSLRSGGGKKRKSFLQRIKDHFKSNKNENPKAEKTT